MAVESKRPKDLPSQIRTTYERGREAVEKKNYAYGTQMLKTVLDREPGVFEARKMLRRAQLEQTRGKSAIVRKLVAWPKAFWVATVTGPGLLKKGKYAKALSQAEKALDADPTNVTAVRFFARAAEEAELLETGIHTVEIAVRQHPDHLPLIRLLAHLHGKSGDTQKQLELLQRVASLKPNDLAAQKEMRQASATNTMQKGKWTEATSYRDVIKDEELAQQLEKNEQITARDTETINKLIEAAEKGLEEQENVTLHRKLGELYRRKKEYDTSLEHYNRVIELTGATDPAIEEAINTVTLERFDDAIRQWQEYARKHPDKKETADEKIRAIREQKNARQFEMTKDLVQRYPNEAEHRFRYGRMLFERGEVDEALKHFQASINNPHFRRDGLVCIGKCMQQKGMLDLAIEQYEKALEAAGSKQDTASKETRYHLAAAYEEKGDSEKALEQFKRIYSGDANYRDVAERVERLYRKSEES